LLIKIKIPLRFEFAINYRQIQSYGGYYLFVYHSALILQKWYIPTVAFKIEKIARHIGQNNIKIKATLGIIPYTF